MRTDLQATLSLGIMTSIVSVALLEWPQSGWATILGWMMVAIAVSDAQRFIVPDWLSLPAIPIGLLASGSFGTQNINEIVSPAHLIGMTVGAVALLSIQRGYMLWRGHPGLGLGDVKLAAVAGAWTGLQGLLLVILIASCSALIFVLLTIGKRRLFGNENKPPVTLKTAIPFGTFLAPSIWLIYMTQALN